MSEYTLNRQQGFYKSFYFTIMSDTIFSYKI